jgi:hypothetical protein
MAENTSRPAQASMGTMLGSTGETSQMATPSSITPKARLTPSIHGPGLGRALRASTPTTISGAPMPRAMVNRAAPPSTALPVWAM